jgi:hypothetical protein
MTPGSNTGGFFLTVCDSHKEAPHVNIHQVGRNIERMEWRLERIERLLLRILKEDVDMKQSTQDLVDAVTQLSATTDEIGTAIDALVAAQGEDDSDAIEAQVEILKGLAPKLKSHLPAVAAAGTAVAQAPSDPAANVAADIPQS